MSAHPWYRRYGADFIAGTLGLSLEEKGAYSIILDLIYDRGGPIPDEPRYIAGVCGCSLRKWSAIRDRLISFGKIIVCEGRITNARAEKEIEISTKTAEKHAENGSKGGRKRAENASPSKENNNIDQARLNHRAPVPEPDTRYNNHHLSTMAAGDSGGGEAFDAKMQVAKAMGFEWRDAKLKLDFGRVDQWLADGYDLPMILDVVVRTMAQKLDGPPGSLNYFDRPLARAKAQRSAPMPSVPASGGVRTFRPRGDQPMIVVEGEPDAMGRKRGHPLYGARFAI